jgi:suppressor of fused-like protein
MSSPALDALRVLLRSLPSNPDAWLYLADDPKSLEDLGFWYLPATDEESPEQVELQSAWLQDGWQPYVSAGALAALADPMEWDQDRVLEALFDLHHGAVEVQPADGPDDDAEIGIDESADGEDDSGELAFGEDPQDEAPGWAAIDEACDRLYAGQSPQHFGSAMPAFMGGGDVLQGISVWKRLQPVPHWHYVGYGLSDLYENSHDAEHSGWGIELSFRLACAEDATQPPAWALNFLQNLARYVDTRGNVFRSGDWMTANGPIALDQQTRLCSMGFVLDPELGRIDTPHGYVDFIQVVGLTQAEELAAKRWNTAALLDALSPHMPLWITDLARPCLLEQPTLQSEVENGIQRDGSSSGLLYADVLEWQQHKRLLRAPLIDITLGARVVDDLLALLPLRLPYGRDFMLRGAGRLLSFQPAEFNRVDAQVDRLDLHLSASAVQGMLTSLRAKAGTYEIPGFAGLRLHIQRSHIRDAAGEVVRTIG